MSETSRAIFCRKRHAAQDQRRRTQGTLRGKSHSMRFERLPFLLLQRRFSEA